MAETLISPGIQMQEIDQSAIAPRPLVAGAAILGPTVKGPVKVPTKVTSYPDYVRTFGTTFTIASGSVNLTHEFLTSIAAKNFFEQGGDSLLVTRIAPEQAFTSAQSTVIYTRGTGSAETSSSEESFEIFTLSQGDLMNSCENSTFTPCTSSVSASVDERPDGSLINGSAENLRFEISNVNENAGTFSLIVRRGDDTRKEQIVLESFNNLSLDPNNRNYIARVIGDQVTSIHSAEGDTYLETTGQYANVSKYIRVKVLKPTPNYLDTAGDPIEAYKALLPIEQLGAFQGATGTVGKCYNGSSEVAAGVAHYFDKIKGTEGENDYNQSVKASDYQDAIELLSNSDEYQINIVSAPGLLDTGIVSSLIGMVEGRGDCIAVVDLVEYGKTPSQVAQESASQNSSYAATYWPWLQMYSSDGRLVWCPASTVIPGVYTYTDHQTAPWYAPAGMTRGGVQGVVQTERKLTKKQRDVLYEKNVNPIATMPGAGIVVYGQKTLQKKASAFDRVNVRRLLIEVKDTVKKMASGLLFEQNTTALQNSFRAQLDPYLNSLVQRNGLTGYSIDLSGNTPDAIDRNEFHCNLVLQPTKTIEFVYLTFTVTATGVSFE